ncbi:hypothetical protein ACXIK0_004873 [Klebsiella pneumoniae]
MGFKKSEVSQLNSLASAIKLIEFDANKYTITHLHGRKVADSLEYSKGINTRKGVGKWLGEKSAMLLSNVVVNNAIHIFGYDPQNPTESTREMDFNALVDLLINTAIRRNTTRSRSTGLSKFSTGCRKLTIKTYCLVCKKPFIHAPDRYDSCPTCSAKNAKLLLCVIISP